MSPVLESKNIRLRPLQRTDAQALVNAASDGELWSLSFTAIPSADNISDYVNLALEGQVQGTVLPFVVIDKSSDTIIGTTRFWKIDKKNRNLEIGHTWYSASWQRTSANTESKFLLLTYAFEILNCIRVQFTTDVLNERSQCAISRLGAQKEGVIRNERIMPDGRFRDSIRYSIIDSEWRKVKKDLETKMLKYH